jgi:hypothetical protein
MCNGNWYAIADACVAGEVRKNSRKRYGRQAKYAAMLRKNNEKMQ